MRAISLKRLVGYRQVYEGGKLPRGYGIAYYSYEGCGYVCYPLGLNWIVGWIRLLRLALWKAPRQRAEVAAYQQGEHDTLRWVIHTFIQKRETAEEDIRRRLHAETQ